LLLPPLPPPPDFEEVNVAYVRFAPPTFWKLSICPPPPKPHFLYAALFNPYVNL